MPEVEEEIRCGSCGVRCDYCGGEKEDGNPPTINYRICWRCRVEQDYGKPPMWLWAAYCLEAVGSVVFNLLSVCVLYPILLVCHKAVALKKKIRGVSVPVKRNEGNEEEFQ